MKIKSKEKAFYYGFKPIVKEENLPSKQWEWSDNITDEECDRFYKIEELSNMIEQTSLVVNWYNPLYFFDNCFVYEIGHSRRGQHYYILCDENTLELSLFTSSGNGEGSDVDFPKVIYNMVINGDILL